jgi:hypothetical protein
MRLPTGSTMASNTLMFADWLAIRTAISARSAAAIMGSLVRGARAEVSSMGTFPGCKQQAEMPNFLPSRAVTFGSPQMPNLLVV